LTSKNVTPVTGKKLVCYQTVVFASKQIKPSSFPNQKPNKT